jgi:hypothetical protein
MAIGFSPAMSDHGQRFTLDLPVETFLEALEENSLWP